MTPAVPVLREPTGELPVGERQTWFEIPAALLPNAKVSPAETLGRVFSLFPYVVRSISANNCSIFICASGYLSARKGKN